MRNILMNFEDELVLFKVIVALENIKDSFYIFSNIKDIRQQINDLHSEDGVDKNKETIENNFCVLNFLYYIEQFCLIDVYHLFDENEKKILRKMTMHDFFEWMTVYANPSVSFKLTSAVASFILSFDLAMLQNFHARENNLD